VVIPAESVEGSYYVLAKTAHHETTSVPFTIAGTAMTETDQGRSQEDGLLVAATAPGEPQLIPPAGPGRPLLIAGVLVTIGLGLIVARRRKPRTNEPDSTS